MKLSWRDILAAALVAFGSVVVYAKLQAYSWWFLGSWKGALGVITVIGLAVLATYIIDWYRNEAGGVLAEMFVWFAAALFVVGCLLATTNKAEFAWSAVLMGLAWVGQLGAHVWDSAHDHTSHMAPVH